MDPSNSFESQAFDNANQLDQTETITCMSCDSYNAAAKGNIDFFKAITNQSLDLQRTPNKNTILHIYITSATPNEGSESTTNFVKKILKICPSLLWQANAKSETPLYIVAGSKSTTNFVEEILEMCPSLLRQANAKGETPLHIAARYGHDDIVEDLIKYCAQPLHDQDPEEGIEPVMEMLRMTNKEKDTASHEAVRYNHLKVVKLLISKDPDFLYPANDVGETPLYIAVERKFKDVLFEILDKCTSPMHGGPLGRTALHAAVIQNCDKGMIERILEKIEGISRKVDNKGWTPLHLAAYFNHGNIAKQLLDKDREVAYMKDTEGRTPFHIAAQRGCVDAMKVIVEMCPDCCELVDNRGRNVLHFAVEGGSKGCREKIMEIIIKNRFLSNLLNEKNADGDTPLHLYSNSTSLISTSNFLKHPRVDKIAFNKQNHNAREIASTLNLSDRKVSEIFGALGQLPQRVITHKDENTDKQDEETRLKLQKASEVHLVVATLIATVTFAACINMPGGFLGEKGKHQGSVLLRKNAAFNAFVVTDTISMVLSSCAVFMHLLIPFIFDKNIDGQERRTKLVILAFKFIVWAMIAMGLAFVTGTYAVLEPSVGLGIANCIIGVTFFSILQYVNKKIVGLSFYEIFWGFVPWKLEISLNHLQRPRYKINISYI